jgi:plastocyanin
VPVRGWRAALVVAALLSGLLVTVPVANAAATYNVEVGRFFKASDNSSESLRFYPAGLKVHQGDVVHFTTKSFHGVSILPAGVGATDWLKTYAGGVDRPYSLFESDPDEGVRGYKMNLRVLSPSLPCGWPTQDACSFDGSDPDTISGVLNSGLALFATGNGSEARQLSFRVAINADPGQSFDVVDVLHPGMGMHIEVVPGTTAASDQAALDQESTRLFGIDAKKATSLNKSYRAKRVKRKIGGKWTWSVWAGIETPTIALRKMYPPKLTIRKSERVRWLFNKNVYSAHTVTFPLTRGRKTAGAFPTIVCDPDGDTVDPTGEEKPAPDTRPTSSDPPYCASYSQLEFDVPPGMPGPMGDAKVTRSSDLASSGIRGKGFATTVAPYTLAFTKPSKKGYSYVDMVGHLAQISATGKIVVKGK